MTVVAGDGWVDDTCPCGQVLYVACDCSDDRGMSPSEPTDEVVDRMMIDEKFYDNIVGWF